MQLAVQSLYTGAFARHVAHTHSTSSTSAVASSRLRGAPGFNGAQGDRAEAGGAGAGAATDASVPLCLHLLQIRPSGAHPIAPLASSTAA